MSMTKSQVFWEQSHRLLSEPRQFEAERDRVLHAYPSLNSQGLGQVQRKRRQHYNIIRENYPLDLGAARNELRAGGVHERGIRNTLEYFLYGKVSLSYRLRGCNWARHFGGPAPPRESSYVLSRRVGTYPQEINPIPDSTGAPARTDLNASNGAFICACLMVGLRVWKYRNSIHVDIRLGRPWAVAGLRPNEFTHPQDITMARFWRWAVQQDWSIPDIEEFTKFAVEHLYDGASLRDMRELVYQQGGQIQSTFLRLRKKFGLHEEVSGLTGTPHPSSRLGFLVGRIKVPDDFDQMGASEIKKMFGVN